MLPAELLIHQRAGKAFLIASLACIAKSKTTTSAGYSKAWSVSVRGDTDDRSVCLIEWIAGHQCELERIGRREMMWLSLCGYGVDVPLYSCRAERTDPMLSSPLKRSSANKVWVVSESAKGGNVAPKIVRWFVGQP